VRLRLPALALATLLLAACTAGRDGAAPVLEVVRPPAVCERLEYTLVQPGETLGSGTLLSRRQPNAPAWDLDQAYVSALDTERLDESHVTVDASLHPQASRRVIAQMGNLDEAGAEYRTTEERAVAVLTRVITGQAPVPPAELRLRDHAYDNESAFWLWRSLPLEEGYRARYTSVNAYERNQTTVDLSVVGRAEVTVPGGAFEAWRLLVVAGRATRTAWIEVAPPHRLVLWDNGVSFMQFVRDSSEEYPCHPEVVAPGA
jgi:hypothetical protein